MMNPATIAAIVHQITALRDFLGADDADEGLREDMIEGETDAIEIARRITRQRQHARANGMAAANAKKDLCAKLDARMDRFEREEEACDAMLRLIMDAMGTRKLTLPEATVSLQAGRTSLKLSDDFTPPQGYAKPTIIDPDKAAIKAALEAGEKMEGATLILGQPIVSVR